MVSFKSLLLTFASVAGLAEAVPVIGFGDWHLDVTFKGESLPYTTHGLSNSGCHTLPILTKVVTGFKYKDNAFTDTISFYKDPNCITSPYSYVAPQSQTFKTPYPFKSYSIF